MHHLAYDPRAKELRMCMRRLHDFSFNKGHLTFVKSMAIPLLLNTALESPKFAVTIVLDPSEAFSSITQTHAVLPKLKKRRHVLV